MQKWPKYGGIQIGILKLGTNTDIVTKMLIEITDKTKNVGDGTQVLDFLKQDGSEII